MNTSRAEYEGFVADFSKLMVAELVANDFKGGVAGWTDPKQLMYELYYHAGKLQEAIRAADMTHVTEFAADCANLGLIILHACREKPLQVITFFSDGEYEPAASGRACVFAVEDGK